MLVWLADPDAVGREHFERGALRRRGSSVRIFADEQRTGEIFGFAEFTDGQRDGEDVRLGERSVERRATMAAGAKADELFRIRGVRFSLVVIKFKLADINQYFRRRRFSG